MEQITGEIEDEHDTDADPDFVVRSEGVVEADARVPLAEFEQRVGTLFTDEEREANDTLGGLVSFLAGRVPTRGELIKHASGVEFANRRCRSAAHQKTARPQPAQTRRPGA